MSILIDLAERGFLPDSVIRAGIRRLCSDRLREESSSNCEMEWHRFYAFCDSLKDYPIAVETAAANEQHYEVPAHFFTLALGKNRKYSSCLWNEGVMTLDQAEDDMLALYLERAELRDGMSILELGCGWGSLTLWMASKLPNARITAVSNSNSQREFIESECQKRGIANVRVITADMNTFDISERFDRVVSIEMFEHMRNYHRLFEKVAGWLNSGGKLFLHIFCHRRYAYLYETEGRGNWMGRYFFTGGTMPSEHLFLYTSRPLVIDRQWRVNGQHYEKTSNAWLSKLDQNREEALTILRAVYGEEESIRWFNRWRLFFMACAELFGYQGGNEWIVAHYRFIKV